MIYMKEVSVLLLIANHHIRKCYNTSACLYCILKYMCKCIYYYRMIYDLRGVPASVRCELETHTCGAGTQRDATRICADTNSLWGFSADCLSIQLVTTRNRAYNHVII